MSSEEQEKEVQQKPKSNKLLIILPLLVVLLGGGAAGAYFKFFKASAVAGKEEATKEEAPVYQEMDTFMVNLADPGGKRFLKATIKTRVNSPKVAEEMKERAFELRDLVLMILTSKEVDDVSRAEDKMTLKKEIMTSLNRVLHNGQVVDVYFTDFLVQ